MDSLRPEKSDMDVAQAYRVKMVVATYIRSAQKGQLNKSFGVAKLPVVLKPDFGSYS